MSLARVVLAKASFSPAAGTPPVVRDVDAVAVGGRVTVVVGANAAGKTTMLRTVAGLRPVHSGRVTIESGGVSGEPWRMPARLRARRISMLTQRVGLAAGFGVGESVALGRHALPPRPDRVEEAIERCALGALRDRAVETLSIGQQQRVGLARTLAQHEPGGVLLLDEPFAPLDLRETARAATAIRSAAEAGAVVLASIHDLGLAARFGDDVWLLDGGRLAAAGPAAEVLAPSRLASLFGIEAIRLAGLDDLDGSLPHSPRPGGA